LQYQTRIKSVFDVIIERRTGIFGNAFHGCIVA
jgi:hypothetical protein